MTGPLSMSLKLPPKEAVAFFRQKGYRIGFDYRDVEPAEHQASFTVAKAMQHDLLADIRTHLDQALTDGTTLKTFRDSLRPNLVKRGWWGKAMMTDPQTGEEKLVQLGSPRRLKVIYDTNLRTAHAEGQWERIQATKASQPYLMYDHTPSAHERPQHEVWDGLVLPVDDPWWLNHYPIKEYGCKCGVVQMGPLPRHAVAVVLVGVFVRAFAAAPSAPYPCTDTPHPPAGNARVVPVRIGFHVGRQLGKSLIDQPQMAGG